MTPEEQLARVRAYKRRQRQPVWPLLAAVLLVLAGLALGFMCGWLLGYAA